MKILIAEDNPLNKFLMSKFMMRLAWDYEIADTGLQAIQFCKSGDFDAILMDIDLPVLDGVEATRQIRSFNSIIPIIAITAYTDEKMKSACAEAGMTYFLAKPCSCETIRSTITEYAKTKTVQGAV